ncbi:MAG: chromosome segregation protein SMC [Alphaproteobacteria bacterium]|nr:chromosome segregation protein SMC [Alphaproteobacteria bacterium]
MKFTRLRLSGFKSFTEPTELLIEPGLTAIVGPNGCGKSNLFDALRWVMGETRPTSVRGSEMDDVIFSGSANRPSRNMAEVSLVIDNSQRQASGAFAEFDTIEVSRRIEREAGSVYRINGRDVRQRDVQIFFADASTGAASTAFVRQGQIGLLISQKPLARRAILEEAAGISGLHQRRHEAELRLRAAETNLARLDDVIREVETQLQNLRRQARQASRYRNLSGHIRRAEALAHFLRWTAAQMKLGSARDEFSAAASMVQAATARAAESSSTQANAASAMPALREAEAARSAALHRLIVEREALDAEDNRARESAQRLRQQIAQTEEDERRETDLSKDAGIALEAATRELGSIQAAGDSAAQRISESEEQVRRLNVAVEEAEAELQQLTAALADWNASRASALRSRDAARAAAQSTEVQLVTAKAVYAEAAGTLSRAEGLSEAELKIHKAREQAEGSRRAFSDARNALAKAESEEVASRTPLEQAEIAIQRLLAEARALGDLLHAGTGGRWTPLVDSVTVQPGYEAALAAALGEELQASLDEASPTHWRELELANADVEASLPERVAPLSRFVVAPPALRRRLDMTGVVFPDQGTRLQTALKPGQRLVSPRGDLWRWDGYCASADAPSRAAVRLAQRNRMIGIEEEITKANQQRSEAAAHHAAAKDAVVRARQAEHAAERAARESESVLVAAQEGATHSARAEADRTAQVASLEAELRRLEQAIDAARLAEREADAQLQTLGNAEKLNASAAEARTGMARAREEASEARAILESLKRESTLRSQRLAVLENDCARWRSRQDAALSHITELERRRQELLVELQAAESLPARIRERKQSLLDAIASAELVRNDAADQRAKAEATLAEADREMKLADAALSAAREERARAQALHEAAETRVAELTARIRDELNAEPDALSAEAEIEEGQELPPLDQAEKRVERLKQEREQLGGVNLRAEEEAEEYDQRLQTLTVDRADLQGAIDRLRRGIQSLNREGRERLVESFAKVNKNFQELFTKLFQGGEAKLTFTESEDPLEAGLEIFARPPGKRLQSLALLSGGEQALTALALIFAVFLVNPAPVCVLDEVDAPLDDANVERFCNLLDEMTRLADTRFLVITHHALTMSRMHRLFGVTMAERGISQLVSVNLSEAERVAAE